MTRFRLPLEEPKSLVHCVGHMPIEVKDLSPSPPCENDASHLQTASLGKFLPEVRERRHVSALRFSKSLFDGGERFAVGEDFGGLLERFVLVDRDQDGSRFAPPGDDDVLPEVGDAIDDAGEIGTKLTDGDRFGHRQSVPSGVHMGSLGRRASLIRT